MKGRLLISGGSGFIAGALCRDFASRGFEVVVTTSSPGQPNSYCFGDRVNSEILDGVMTVVHAAYDSRLGTRQLNIDGTVALSEAARKQGVQSEVFISSFSALTGVKSDYAEVKRALEKYFLGLPGTSIIRPGLVIGNGGLFAKMAQVVRLSPIIPLIDGGRSAVPVIGLSDLLRAILHLTQTRQCGEFNLLKVEKVSLFSLLNEYARQQKLHRYFLNVPSSPILLLIRALESLGLRLPISTQNLQGLRANQGAEFQSHLHELIGRELSLEKLLAELTQNSNAT